MLYQMSDGNGFWDITPEELIDLITYIETESNFSPCAYSNLPLIDLYECDGVSIDEESINKSLIKTLDILGRETTNNKGFQLQIYDDGSVEKKYVIK